MDFETLSLLRKKHPLRNPHLRKYEIRKDEIDIGIYVPTIIPRQLKVRKKEALERLKFT